MTEMTMINFPPPGETPDPPSDTISSDFPELPTNPTPNPPSGIGSSGLSCQEFSNIPTENAFYVRGLQDTAWQRAILSDPGEKLLSVNKNSSKLQEP